MTKRIYNQGGLGNQLFIWQAAHDLHFLTNEPVEIVARLSKDDSRPLELRPVLSNCSHPIHIKEVSDYNLRVKLSQKYPRIHSKLKSVLPPKFLIQISQNVQDPIQTLHISATDFLGFFQDSINPYWDLRRLDCEIISTLEAHSPQRLISKYGEPISSYQVFHVRRGDYVQFSDTLGLLSSEYYATHKSDNLPIIICTDSNKLEDEFQIDFPDAMIFTSQDLDTWSSLALMTKAELFIGSNSTLSWWAAKLRSGQGLRSVLPNPWFKTVENQPNFFRPSIEFLDAKFRN